MQKSRRKEHPRQRPDHRTHRRWRVRPDEEADLGCRGPEGLGQRCLLRQPLQGHHR